jgi:hypothetical protein
MCVCMLVGIPTVSGPGGRGSRAPPLRNLLAPGRPGDDGVASQCYDTRRAQPSSLWPVLIIGPIRDISIEYLSGKDTRESCT